MPGKSAKKSSRTSHGESNTFFSDIVSGKLFDYHTSTNASSTTRVIASGGNFSLVEPGNGYLYHTFTSNGTLSVTNGGTAEILLVAGGGSGNYGGGGAGGIVSDTNFNLKSGTYTVTVGAGSTYSPYSDASDSVLSHPKPQVITALAGGSGGTTGTDGGSGAGGRAAGNPNVSGGAGNQPGQSQIGGSPLLLQFGNPAGNLNAQGRTAGAGGGGAGEIGGATNPTYADGNNAYGGDGLQYLGFTGNLIGIPALNPLNGWYAGGGAGADNFPGAATGPGGDGGGGPQGTAGVQYSGGGGGGSYKPGGPGIVVIRYLA